MASASLSYRFAGIFEEFQMLPTQMRCKHFIHLLMIFVKAMRAVSEDRAAAQLMGINVNQTISTTFAIGSALAAIAGVLLCSTVPTLMPTTGSMPGIRAFTAAVFGGIGSIPGAMLGGILLGIIETFSKAYLSTQFSDAIVFLYASILAPVWEELLFRGYILRTLRPYGKRFAILSSAVLFGLFHGNLLQTPYALLMGLVLGYVTVEYSIIWAMLVHMFNNLVLADLLTRLTANWSEMAYGMLNMILFGGSALVSVLVLLKNRGEIQAYRRGEWIDRRCLKCFFTSGGVLVLTLMMCISMVMLLIV